MNIYAAHQYFLGPSAVGDLFIGKADCGVTVTPGSFPPTNSSAPTLTGAPTQGQTLTEAHGSWTNSPTAFAYQWLDCDSAGNSCAPIAGASAPTYALTTSDVGHTVRVQETASNTDGPSSPASSAATGVVQASAAPPNQPPPSGPPSSGPPPTAAQIKALLLGEITPKGKPARIRAIVKAGGYPLAFKALTAGSSRVDWSFVPAGAHLASAQAKPLRVVSGHRTFPSAGTAKLKLKLTPAGRRLLKHAKHLKLTARGSFTPTGAAPVRARKTFTLKR